MLLYQKLLTEDLNAKRILTKQFKFKFHLCFSITDFTDKLNPAKGISQKLLCSIREEVKITNCLKTVQSLYGMLVKILGNDQKLQNSCSMDPGATTADPMFMNEQKYTQKKLTHFRIALFQTSESHPTSPIAMVLCPLMVTPPSIYSRSNRA